MNISQLPEGIRDKPSKRELSSWRSKVTYFLTKQLGVMSVSKKPKPSNTHILGLVDDIHIDDEAYTLSLKKRRDAVTEDMTLKLLDILLEKSKELLKRGLYIAEDRTKKYFLFFIHYHFSHLVTEKFIAKVGCAITIEKIKTEVNVRFVKQKNTKEKNALLRYRPPDISPKREEEKYPDLVIFSYPFIDSTGSLCFGAVVPRLTA